VKLRLLIPAAAVAVAATPSAAYASDFTGTLPFMGLPVMAVASLGYGLLAWNTRKSRGLHIVACVLFIPLALFGVLCAADGLENFKMDRQHPDRTSAIQGTCLYYAVATLCFVCFCAMVFRWWTHETNEAHGR
jgi:hypothetical protein